MRIPFTSSPRSSLGVEWELQLVDGATRELTSAVIEILDDIRPYGVTDHPKVKHETLQSTIELITGVCETVAEARADLTETARTVASAAANRGIALMCAGTHPVTHWATQVVTPRPRYERLTSGQPLARRWRSTLGLHVHVGVRSPEKIMPIVNGLTAYVPHLLALSASSPFWCGRDTGLASARSKIREALPTAGLPYQLKSWDRFEGYMKTLIDTQTIESIKDVYWDIRPQPGFGTVELRICDGVPTLDEVAVIAALSQCLVEKFDQQLDRGQLPPVPEPWVVRENKWRATLSGLDAEIIVDDADVVPVRQALLDLVDELMPVAQQLSCADELADIDRILAAGASYQRQRATAEANGGDLTAVVDSLVDETATGLPVPAQAGRVA